MMPAQDSDLQQLEREAFRKFYDDGLLDIFLGLLLALMPVTEVLGDHAGETSRLVLLVAVNGALVLLYILGRRLIVRPRLGTFVPARPRKRKVVRARLILGGSVLLGLLFFAIFAAGRGAGLLAIMPLVWLANCIVVFGAMAWFLDVPRFFFYGFLYGGPLAVDATGVHLPLVAKFVLPGAVIVAVGVFKLLRFLRHYPPRSGEVADRGT